MPLEFTKMHGAGNDFVCVSLYDQIVKNPPELTRDVCDRQRGVGADGLILIGPPDRDTAHVNMEIYNANGSRAEMCGNGIRGVAKLAYERGWARFNPVRIETDAGVFEVELMLESALRVRTARVDLGAPILDPRRIPVEVSGDRAVDVSICIDGETLKATCVSFGNPHTVVFVDSLEAVPLRDWGPKLESHALFPRRTNTHFVQALSQDRIRMASWERGAGATQSCGTGACAAAVAGLLTGKTGRSIAVETCGGELCVECDEALEHVRLSGPVVEEFRGVWPAD